MRPLDPKFGENVLCGYAHDILAAVPGGGLV